MEHRVVTDSEKDLKSQDRPNRITIKRLKPDMIRPVDGGPKLVNPNGIVSEGRPPPLVKGGNTIFRHDSHQDQPLGKPATLHCGEGTSSPQSRKRRKDPCVITAL